MVKPIFCLFMAFLTTLALAQSQPHGGHHGGMAASMAALERLNGDTFEVAYLSQMIAHHEAAIAMSSELLRLSQDIVLRDMAWDIKADQTFEVGRMQQWLKSWHGVQADAAQMALMRDDMKGMLERFQSEVRSGSDVRVNAAFIEGMIPHHEMAIDMARLAATRAIRPELLEFSKNIVNKQLLEIKLLAQFAASER